MWATFVIALDTFYGATDITFLPLDEAIASRALFVIVSGSDGRTDANAFGAS